MRTEEHDRCPRKCDKPEAPTKKTVVGASVPALYLACQSYVIEGGRCLKDGSPLRALGRSTGGPCWRSRPSSATASSTCRPSTAAPTPWTLARGGLSALPGGALPPVVAGARPAPPPCHVLLGLRQKRVAASCGQALTVRREGVVTGGRRDGGAHAPEGVGRDAGRSIDLEAGE